ncbi:hypothetical protein NUU61_008181 [Penicillium alfredii]|uniref:Uncharacterized protein n=1 Tax=Penicillium alfredii TaxID=1506179 RepID=A0A9W9ES70_9EURO|nr:uncharacterized protein NUU61_008181 [Penicillium alfredii]KAJ5086874.1 hypothetical protein NUU61_008181 [Penicillium alfredii]
MNLLKHLALLGGVAVHAATTASPKPSSTSSAAIQAPTFSPEQVQSLKATIKPNEDDRTECIIKIDLPPFNCQGSKTGKAFEYGSPWPHACWHQYNETSPDIDLQRWSICDDGTTATFRYKSEQLLILTPEGKAVRFGFDTGDDSDYSVVGEQVKGDPSLDLHPYFSN